MITPLFAITYHFPITLVLFWTVLWLVGFMLFFMIIFYPIMLFFRDLMQWIFRPQRGRNYR